MKRPLLDTLLAARAAKRPVALLTHLADGSQQCYEPGSPSPGIAPDLTAAADEALRADRSRTVSGPAGEVFVQAFNPPLRLLVIGAVHIAQALAPMARIAGYQVVIVDPRRSFATDARFPEVDLRTEWPDEVIASLAPDNRTALVTLTHDPKLDDPALHAALRSRAFYIGCLGSTRTHAARLSRLRKAGFDDAALARIHGPLGLAIGARSPAEIALAALAQITSTLRGGSAT